MNFKLENYFEFFWDSAKMLRNLSIYAYEKMYVLQYRFYTYIFPTKKNLRGIFITYSRIFNKKKNWTSLN